VAAAKENEQTQLILAKSPGVRGRMGGSGSGNRYRYDKKSTVEESLTLAVENFHGRLYPHAAGTLTWTWTGGNQSSVGWFVTWDVGGPALTLHYRW
jgi:hypothetical protein